MRTQQFDDRWSNEQANRLFLQKFGLTRFSCLFEKSVQQLFLASFIEFRKLCILQYEYDLLQCVVLAYFHFPYSRFQYTSRAPNVPETSVIMRVESNFRTVVWRECYSLDSEEWWTQWWRYNRTGVLFRMYICSAWIFGMKRYPELVDFSAKSRIGLFPPQIPQFGSRSWTMRNIQPAWCRRS